MARGRCLVTREFNMKTSNVLKERQRRDNVNITGRYISDLPLSTV